MNQLLNEAWYETLERTSTEAQRPLKAVFRSPFPEQKLILDSIAKRIVVKSGRRFGKSTTAATKAVEGLLKRRRTLYATPTQEQIDRFWYEVKLALAEPLAEGLLYKHEGRHIIEIPGTEARALLIFSSSSQFAIQRSGVSLYGAEGCTWSDSRFFRRCLPRFLFRTRLATQVAK